MEIGVLGPLLVVGNDGKPVVQRSALQRVLLASLLAGRGRILEPDELMECLWSDALPADPTAALQSQMSRLRRQLGSASLWIETVRPGYRMVCPHNRLDAQRAERLFAEARRVDGHPAVALERLDRALALWRGRSFQGLADLPAIAAEAVRLEELRGEVGELRAEVLLELGRPADAASSMQVAIVEYPYPSDALLRPGHRTRPPGWG
ncbi:MAG: BTAD domain-containing putative transcriptional regulator [Acidimicrobiales bacterium]